MLHPVALDRDVMSDFFRRFSRQLNHVVIVLLRTVSLVRASAIGLTVYALVKPAYVIQLQRQRLLYAFSIRTDGVVLGLESLDPIDGLLVLHALSIVCER